MRSEEPPTENPPEEEPKQQQEEEEVVQEEEEERYGLDSAAVIAVISVSVSTLLCHGILHLTRFLSMSLVVFISVSPSTCWLACVPFRLGLVLVDSYDVLTSMTVE